MRNNFIDTLQPVSNMRCPPGLPAPIDDPTLAVDTDMVDTVQMLLGTELLRAIDEPVERKSTNIAAERLILSQDDKDESEDEAKSTSSEDSTSVNPPTPTTIGSPDAGSFGSASGRRHGNKDIHGGTSDCSSTTNGSIACGPSSPETASSSATTSSASTSSASTSSTVQRKTLSPLANPFTPSVLPVMATPLTAAAYPTPRSRTPIPYPLLNITDSTNIDLKDPSFRRHSTIPVPRVSRRRARRRNGGSTANTWDGEDPVAVAGIQEPLPYTYPATTATYLGTVVKALTTAPTVVAVSATGAPVILSAPTPTPAPAPVLLTSNPAAAAPVSPAIPPERIKFLKHRFAEATIKAHASKEKVDKIESAMHQLEKEIQELVDAKEDGRVLYVKRRELNCVGSDWERAARIARIDEVKAGLLECEIWGKAV